MSIAQNINHFTTLLQPYGCGLVAISKTKPAGLLQQAYGAGQRMFGENYVQELVAKEQALPGDIQWHFTGHLQSNKVKLIAPFISLIHSVDSFSLLKEINKEGVKAGRIIPCLLQVYIAQEDTKFGFDSAEVEALLQDPALAQMQNIEIAGLMGMASNTDNAAQVRGEFNSLAALFDKLKAGTLPGNTTMRHLSMGMSGDWQIAAEEGATLVRIGSAIFGERNYNQQP